MCTLLPALERPFALLDLPVSGALALPIPAAPQLLAVPVQAQAITSDAQLQPGLSDGLRLTLGW